VTRTTRLLISLTVVYSRAEVRKKAEAAKVEIYGERSPIADKTFRQVAEGYLASARGTIASTTYDRYLDALERDVYPEYANTPMADITDAEVNRFIKVAPGLAEKRGRSLTNSGLLVVKGNPKKRGLIFVLFNGSRVICFIMVSKGREPMDFECGSVMEQVCHNCRLY